MGAIKLTDSYLMTENTLAPMAIKQMIARIRILKAGAILAPWLSIQPILLRCSDALSSGILFF